MYTKKKKRKFNVVLVFILMFFLLLIVSYVVLQKKKALTPVEAIIKDSGLFIQKLIVKPFRMIQKNTSNQEINILKEKAAASDALEAKNKELELQLKKIKKTLELNTVLTERVYLNATVINRNTDYWYGTVTLDKGKKNGIKKNMPVVVSEGLVGVISNVSNYNSTVKLLTNEELPFKISVKIEVGDSYVYGLLTGYQEKNHSLLIEGIADNTAIKEGAIVTTTGLGEEIPAGIIVGYVKNVTTDNFDLAKQVEVESKVLFDELDYVTILKRKDLES